MRRQNGENTAQNGMKYNRENYMNKLARNTEGAKQNTMRRQNSENTAQNGMKYKIEKTKRINLQGIQKGQNKIQCADRTAKTLPKTE